MALAAALLLCAQAAPATPRPIVTATASAFVEVLRAERGAEPDRPDATIRQVRRTTGGGLLVDFN